MEFRLEPHGLGASPAAKQLAQELIGFATAQSRSNEALMSELSHTSQDVEKSVQGLVDPVPGDGIDGPRSDRNSPVPHVIRSVD